MSTPLPRSNTTVAMPVERAIQLRELADHLGGNMSETLQQLFAAARAQGLITGHTLPGVTLNTFKDGVVVQFDDQPRASFTQDGARQLAETIRQFVNSENDKPLFVNCDHKYSVRRKGRGIIVTINAMTENESTKAWNTDLASEFADLIESAINKRTAE